MKIAASMSVGRLAPKHSLNIDGIRAISKNVIPKLIKNDVILIDRLRSQDGRHMTIEEYTDQHFKTLIMRWLVMNATIISCAFPIGKKCVTGPVPLTHR